MKRREFLGVLGGAAAVWPLAATAQQAERVRRIGILMNVAASDPEGLSRIAAFHQGMERLGWSLGRNLRIEYRWAANASERRSFAEELVALSPDVIVAGGASVLVPLQQATRTIPIVFLQVTDPVGAGFVSSLARPGGNTTGFSLFEFTLSVKWLELLKEVSPHVTRVAVLRDRTLPAAIAQFATMQSAAPSLAIELRPFDLRDEAEIEREVGQFSNQPNGALLLTVGPAGVLHSKLLAKLASQHKLPSIYPFRFHVQNGGLLSYGPDSGDMFRRSAEYVVRIMGGEKPADLPVQAPTKYELVINLKTAKTLGLTVPATLLARADEVIE
jgi:putative ABC transport system substrate-binding protein